MNKNAIKINELYKPYIIIHKKYGKGNKYVHFQEKGYKELSVLVTNSIKENL